MIDGIGVERANRTNRENMTNKANTESTGRVRLGTPMWGFQWRVGRKWGLAHPKDECYADGEAVRFLTGDDTVMLHVARHPMTVDGRELNWGVGYISSIEAVKYGTLEVDFKLPKGRKLWPAIWLTDGETWPPEIDIVEAWARKGDYRMWHGMKEVVPTVHWGNSDDSHKQRSGGCFGGVLPWWIKTDGMNHARLVWTPTEIVVEYNGHRVMRCTDKEVLEYMNASKGMEIHLNNYVENGYTLDDYLCSDTTAFFVRNLKYLK